MQEQIANLEKLYTEFSMAFMPDLPAMVSFRKTIDELKSDKQTISIFQQLINECPVCNANKKSDKSDKLENEIQPILVIEKIAEIFHTTPELIKGKSRELEIVKARHLTCFIFIKELGYSVTRAAKQVNRNHSTMTNSCTKALFFIEIDKEVRKKKEIICEYLKTI